MSHLRNLGVPRVFGRRLPQLHNLLVPAAQTVGIDGEGGPALPEGPRRIHDVPVEVCFTKIMTY